MVEIENYGQWLDLEPPKNKRNFKILCTCPKCGKKHIRSYLDLQHSKEFIYCTKHKTARHLEEVYGKGVTSSQLVPGVAERTKATKAKKYGEDWGQKWYENQKKLMLETYGVENIGLADDHMLKSYETMIRKYGSVERAYAFGNNKRIRTAEKKFGSYAAYTRARLDAQIESLRKMYNDPTINSLQDIPTIKEKNFQRYLDELQYFDRVKVLFMNGSYIFKCQDCGFMTPIDYDTRIYRCPQCNKGVKPKGLIMSVSSFITKMGFEVENFYQELDTNLTFDIYVPEKKIAVDIISTMTHSNTRQDELKKRVDICENAGISLISLFEDHWYNKPDQVQARLRAVFDKNDNILNGLDGHISEITLTEYENFCNEHHIYGYGAGAQIKLGLRINGILVAVAGIRPSLKLKEYDWEISRFCVKYNYTIENVFHPFIMWFEHKHSGETLVYYHDRRWPGDTGNAMEFLKDTVASQYFWKDDEEMRHWSKCQKSWINSNANFDYERDIPYRINMYKEGYNVLYDCGFRVYIYG